MADTSFATTNPLTPKIVVPGVLAAEIAKKSYFTKFMGEGSDSIIQKVTNLKKEAGDQLTVALSVKITGDGVTGDSTLEGNEVAMTFKNMVVKIDQRRQAIKLAGKMTEKRAAIQLRKEAVKRLSVWATEMQDEEAFYHLSCARGTRAGVLSLSYAGGAQGGFVTPDAAHVLTAGGLAKATLTAADKLKCSDIDTLVETARLSDDLKPMNVDGMEVLGVLVISPEQATDLRNDTVWQASQRDANVRGNKNPIFDGSMGFYNGVVIHVHRNVVTFDDYGASANLDAARALFLCAQAGIFAEGGNGWSYVEKDTFDYDNQVGFAVGQIYGIKGSAYKDSAGANEALFGRLLLDTAI